jgi:putative DNA primase/helicase
VSEARSPAGDVLPMALAPLVRVVTLAESGADAVGAVAALLDDSAALDGLAAAQRQAPAKVASLLVRLGARKGYRQFAGRLERAIREVATAQQRAESEERFDQATASASRPLEEALGSALAGHELPAGLVSPPGWDVDRSGIARLKVDDDSGEVQAVDVAHRPMIIEGRYRDVHDNTVTYALAWSGAHSGWHVHPVPRGKAADARGLVAFAAHDAPVTSNNAANLVAFLSDFEAANAEHLPEARVTTSMGWHGTGAERCFLWGRSVIGRDGVLVGDAVEDVPPARWRPGQLHLLVTEPGVRALADGFRASGTWEGWLAAVAVAARHPVVMLGIYAALVPPLMAVVPTIANFVVDFCGETSRGKTTTLRLAASVWGNPDERGGGLVMSWDATRVYVERAAALTDYLPTFLDDTKRARKPEDVGRTLYDFASGVGRGRGSLQAIQRTTRSHGVLLSTGEAPATSFTNDGGTRARTLCLWGSPFGGVGPETVGAVHQLANAVLAHHGHAGPRLVSWLLSGQDAVRQVRELYREAVERWTALANGNPVAGRAAHYVAALDLAKALLHGPLGVPAPAEDPIGAAWAAVVDASFEAVGSGGLSGRRCGASLPNSDRPTG